jgi:hypothetical protein
MRHGACAEWILTRFIDRQRASSIVGDLIEEQQRGTVWFWLSLMGVTLSIARRPLGGFLLATFAGGSAIAAIQSKLFTSLSPTLRLIGNSPGRLQLGFWWASSG